MTWRRWRALAALYWRLAVGLPDRRARWGAWLRLRLAGRTQEAKLRLHGFRPVSPAELGRENPAALAALRHYGIEVDE